MKTHRIVLFSALITTISFLTAPAAQVRQKQASQAAQTNAAKNDPPSHFNVNRVLLISIDGMHAIDLADCVQANTCPTLAQLSSTGVTYTNASTTIPSDSYPGLTAQVTGGLPPTTGIWYDDHWDRTLFPAGSNCQGTPGTEVNFAEPIDIDPNALDAGGGIDVTKLPLDPAKGCTPVYPHNHIRVNTIFEVIKGAGLHTAWADKHPAYDLVNGPSGTGVDDLYTPEINSLVPIGTCNGDGVSIDWTKSECAVQMNDGLKVQAILNEIDGFDHARKSSTGVPAIFGMNFQAVSVGQKLHKDYKLGPGGYSYVNGAITPGPALANAISFVDTSIGQMVSALEKNGLLNDTLIIISAKHGQSPIDPSKRMALDASLPAAIIGAPYAFDISDDVSLIWLGDQTQTGNVVQTLSSPANQAALGIQEIFSGNLMKQTFDDPLVDTRTPDIITKVNTGVIFTGGSKIAEHGGMNEDDIHVALLVSNPNFSPRTLGTPVQTKQIAPSILRALAIASTALQAVQIEKTRVLPGLFLEVDPKLKVRYLLSQ